MKRMIRFIKFLFRYCFSLNSEERQILREDQKMISTYGERGYFPDYRASGIYYKLFK